MPGDGPHAATRATAAAVATAPLAQATSPTLRVRAPRRIGQLDEPARQHGQRQRRRHPHREQGRTPEPDPLPVEPEEEREVEQVDAVGDASEGDERGGAEQPADGPAAQRRRQHDDGGDDGGRQQAAPVQAVGELVDDEPRGHHGR